MRYHLLLFLACCACAPRPRSEARDLVPLQVQGRLVRAEDLRPVTTAVVELSARTEVLPQDSAGRFSLTYAAAPGRYRLRIRALGYCPVEWVLRHPAGAGIDLGTVALDEQSVAWSHAPPQRCPKARRRLPRSPEREGGSRVLPLQTRTDLDAAPTPP